MPTTRKIVKANGKYHVIPVHLLMPAHLISEDTDKTIRRIIANAIRKAKRKRRG